LACALDEILEQGLGTPRNLGLNFESVEALARGTDRASLDRRSAEVDSDQAPGVHKTSSRWDLTRRVTRR
jgi:hypothetical protein